MIKLAAFTPDDFDQLIAWMNTPELLNAWSGGLFSFPLKRSSLQWYIEDTNDFSSSECFIYKVVETETGRSVGHISLGGLSKRHLSARITRVFLSPETRGKGYCAEMMRQALEIGFEKLQLHRISLGVYLPNDAAIKCYERSGMRSEGIQKDVIRHSGKFLSQMEMAILRPEWERLKLAAE